MSVRVPRLPAPVPYAGTMSIAAESSELSGFEGVAQNMNVSFQATAVASNVVPHIMRRLVIAGISHEGFNITEATLPPAKLQVVSAEDIEPKAVRKSAARQMWRGLIGAVQKQPGSRLTVGPDKESITGDFGFGLEWLKIYHNYLTSAGIIVNVLTERALELDQDKTASSTQAN